MRNVEQICQGWKNGFTLVFSDLLQLGLTQKSPTETAQN